VRLPWLVGHAGLLQPPAGNTTCARNRRLPCHPCHHHSGQPVAYQLHPAQGPCLLAQPGSVVAQRALFTTRNLWVVPHEEGQLFPAGTYVFQSQRDSGLRVWTQEDRSLLDGADPVLFVTFGVTHFVRPEDWPVMPCDSTGFSLRPVGFFARNAALDVPPEQGGAHGCRSRL
jgi:primary-amine oxidase